MIKSRLRHDLYSKVLGDKFWKNLSSKREKKIDDEKRIEILSVVETKKQRLKALKIKKEAEKIQNEVQDDPVLLEEKKKLQMKKERQKQIKDHIDKTLIPNN